jgi:starch-binding outer membrane protein SusE/F
MKYNKILLALLSLLVIFSACKKVDNTYFPNGKAVTLTSSTTTIVPKAADSTNTVLTLNWTNPSYATDSAHQKFIVAIDTTSSFSNPVTFQVNGPLTYSFTGNQLNNILANFGFVAGKPYNVNIRVTSSYANNNEQYQSNPVVVEMTPFLVPVTLAPSSKSDIVLQVTNAAQKAISFTWNASNYGNNTINYALQIDTVGGNFAHPQIIKYGPALNGDITQMDLNTAGINAGVIGGSTKNVEFRIVSYKDGSYTTPLVFSNAVTLKLTTYVPIPDNLYIVGDATPGGWANPVPVPSQQFTKKDAFSFTINIGLTAGKSYLFLPLNGDWTDKYGGASATGGTLLKDNDVPGSNTPAPATSGVYQIVVNFQTNTYTVTAVPVPDKLYIVGDATPGGWANPVPTPSQEFTKIDAVSFGMITHLGTGSYLLLPLNGNWDHKFGGATDGTANGGGVLLADNAVPGSNTPAPSSAGLYKIIVNFATNSYTVTPYSSDVPANLYIVGDATAGGWANPVPVPSQQFTQTSNGEFMITLPLIGGKSFVFLPLNGNWDHKFGGTTAGTSAPATLLADGDVPGSNTPAPASSGTYTIDVNFITNTYSVK